MGDNIVEEISEPLPPNITSKSIPPHVYINTPDQPNTSFTPDLFSDQSSAKPLIMSNIAAKQPMKSDTTFTNFKKKKYGKELYYLKRNNFLVELITIFLIIDVKLNTQLSNAREVFTNLANTNNQQLEVYLNIKYLILDSQINNLNLIVH